jgi:small-conductance mechanosensitive channel
VTNLTNILFDPTVGKIITVAVGLLIISFLARLAQRWLIAQVKTTDNRYRVRKIVNFASYVMAGLLVIVVFSSQLSGFTVAFGVAGAGIAFALQEVIASIAGWVALSFGDFYRVGNRVQLGGIMGDVIDVGILRTTLMECGDWVNGDLYNGRIVRIANSFVFKEPVFNYSADFPFLWDEITMPIKYGSDRQLAEAILAGAADQVVKDFTASARRIWPRMVEKYSIEEAQVEPMITLVANDNWLEYTLRYVTDFRQRRKTKDQLFRIILDGIDAANGRVAVASTTIQIVETPTFNVRLNNDTQPASGKN